MIPLKLRWKAEAGHRNQLEGQYFSEKTNTVLMKTRTVRSKRQKRTGKFIYMNSDIVGKIYSTEPKCCCTAGLPGKAAGAASVRDHACEVGTSCWKLDWNSGPKPRHSPMERPPCFNSTLCCIFAREKAGWFGFFWFFYFLNTLSLPMISASRFLGMKVFKNDSNCLFFHKNWELGLRL